ncbi:hypothetical protein B5M42_011585 [Paenibacillus athensensis]|uniref:Uncharacterized protein n=2 Tax=Paenibacillus athensensis TaxID=1967502 RepID=A0A4Y8Q7L4_9BACL|nr:hypothetical protein [Paenibacillus athensensis]
MDQEADRMKRREIKPVVLKQPKRCKGCVWGHWEGVRQYCSRPICAKEQRFFEENVSKLKTFLA